MLITLKDLIDFFKSAEKGSLPCIEINRAKEFIEFLYYISKKIDKLEDDFELERMRNVACSVVSLSNTRDSLDKVVKNMNPDYRGALVNDVIKAVEREISLREDLEKMREQRDEARIEICAFVHSESVVEHFRTGEGVISPEQVAEDRGWDCFSKEKRS